MILACAVNSGAEERKEAWKIRKGREERGRGNERKREEKRGRERGREREADTMGLEYLD